MSKLKSSTNEETRIQVTHPRKKRKLSPNRNHHKNKHSKWHQNKHSIHMNNNQNNHNNKTSYKYEQDLYETNKYLKRKIKAMQQFHSQQILELKQKNSSKIHKLESKAIKLSTNLKKLGKMYQKLQTEYDNLLEQHQNLLDCVENNNDNINDNTIHNETQYPFNELLQSLNNNNNKHSNHIKSQINDNEMTIIEYEEKKSQINDNNNYNRKENEYEYENENANDNTKENELLSNKIICKNNNNNSYIVNNVNHTNGLSLQWNDNDEFDKLENKNINSNHNYREYKQYLKDNNDNNNENVNGKGSPIKYVETVRGRKRDELPGHECIQCERFYALNNNLNGNKMNGGKLCNCVSRHRAKHKLPATPQHFWSIDFATQQ